MDESKVSSVSFPVLPKHLLPSLLPKRRTTMNAEQFEEDDHPQVEKVKAWIHLSLPEGDILIFVKKFNEFTFELT